MRLVLLVRFRWHVDAPTGLLEAGERPAGLVLDLDARLPHGGHVDVQLQPLA